MRITCLNRASSTSSKSSSSIAVACLENTLKFTPSRHGVAPRGELVPCRGPSAKSERTGIDSISSIVLTERSVKWVFFRITSGHWAWFRIPDLGRVLRDGAVAGELAGAGDVHDDLASPLIRVAIQLKQPLVRLKVGRKVRQVHVVVAAGQQGLAQRLEDTRLETAEVVGEDQVERRTGLMLVVVVPVRAVPASAAGHLLRRQAEHEEVVLSRSLGHLDRGAVARSDGQSAVHHELHVARPAG